MGRGFLLARDFIDDVRHHVFDVSLETVSLRFKHGSFAMGFMYIVKPLSRRLREGVGSHHHPTPPVGLLGVPYPRRRPSQALLEEAEGVLQIEAPHVRAPDETQIRRRPLRPVPPQPQDLRLPPTLAS